MPNIWKQSIIVPPVVFARAQTLQLAGIRSPIEGLEQTTIRWYGNRHCVSLQAVLSTVYCKPVPYHVAQNIWRKTEKEIFPTCCSLVLYLSAVASSRQAGGQIVGFSDQYECYRLSLICNYLVLRVCLQQLVCNDFRLQYLDLDYSPALDEQYGPDWCSERLHAEAACRCSLLSVLNKNYWWSAERELWTSETHLLCSTEEEDLRSCPPFWHWKTFKWAARDLKALAFEGKTPVSIAAGPEKSESILIFN